MAVKNDPEQIPGVLVVIGVVIAAGLFSWYGMGQTERRSYLEEIRVQEGIEDKLPKVRENGQSPATMILEFKWVLQHRLERLKGMILFMLQVFGAVICEGLFRRKHALMAGFGLGMFTFGRVMGLVWLVSMGGFLVVPVPIPYGVGCVVVSFGLGVSGYLLTRGMPRAH